jgi:predicted nucleotide-binding protein
MVWAVRRFVGGVGAEKVGVADEEAFFVVVQLEQRRDLFLGYCSNAADVADKVKAHLAKLGASVLDCSAGIFLFTKDDPLRGQKDHASLRDNVMFEAGYFACAKGKERVLIVREAGSKMPADLDGDIYVLLEDRTDIDPIKSTLEKFLETRL